MISAEAITNSNVKKKEKTSLAHHLSFSKNFDCLVILRYSHAYMPAAIHHFSKQQLVASPTGSATEHVYSTFP